MLASVLQHNGLSLILMAAFALGSAGILALPDLSHDLWLNTLDLIKPLIGLKPHNEEILYQDFKLASLQLKGNSSHHKLHNLMPSIKNGKNNADKKLLTPVAPRQKIAYGDNDNEFYHTSLTM